MLDALIGGLGDLKGLLTVSLARVSSLGEHSHSNERQTDVCAAFRQRHDMVDAGTAEDINVSGAIKPWNRPQLGPWLRGELGPFDVLLAPTLDRISRNQFDYLELREWCMEHGIKLIVAEWSLDLASDAPMPMLMGSFASAFAQMEHATITKRVNAGRKTSRSMKKAMGGQMPYWCQQVPHESGKGFRWVKHPERSRKTLEWIEAIEGGKTRTSMARELNAAGVSLPAVELRPEGKTARGQRGNNQGKGYAGKWTATTFKAMLLNRALIGQMQESVWEKDRKMGTRWRKRDTEGRPLPKKVLMEETVDDDGNIRIVPVENYIESLLVKEDGSPDIERFNRLLALLTSGKKKGTPPGPLNGVVHCFACNSPRYESPTKTDGVTYRYLRCSSDGTENRCASGNVREEKVRNAIAAHFVTDLGDKQVFIPAKTQGRDVKRDLDALYREQEDLISELVGASQTVKDRFAPRKAALAATIADLESRAAKAKPGYVTTGKTVRELWSDKDWDSNGEIMRQLNIKVFVKPLNRRVYEYHFEYPADIDDRLRALAV